MCLYATAEHVSAGIEPRQRSVANVLRAFRRPMQEYKSTPDEGEDMESLVAKAINSPLKKCFESEAEIFWPRSRHKIAGELVDSARFCHEETR